MVTLIDKDITVQKPFAQYIYITPSLKVISFNQRELEPFKEMPSHSKKRHTDYQSFPFQGLRKKKNMLNPSGFGTTSNIIIRSNNITFHFHCFSVLSLTDCVIFFPFSLFNFQQYPASDQWGVQCSVY